jgi:hypothetical protein
MHITTLVSSLRGMVGNSSVALAIGFLFIFSSSAHSNSLERKVVEMKDMIQRGQNKSTAAGIGESERSPIAQGHVEKVTADRPGVPFVDALSHAGVKLESMKDGQSESLILGNGDLYGIVWEKEGDLFMRITKNDIWDARVDTSKDGDLPHVDLDSNKIASHYGAPASYGLPYPQPRCAAALRLGPVPEKMSAELTLAKAVVTIRSGEQHHTTLRILHQKNVLLIQGPSPIELEEIKAKTLPNATLGKTDGVSWLLMDMPGDTDYKGMKYALALAVRGNLKAISLVTTFDSGKGDVLKRAIALAQETVATETEKLISEHELAWQRYWSRSGIMLGDKTIERWWYRLLYFASTVCRPGAAPVGILPPLATDKTPWHADFHHNYNTWQAFWPLPAANHGELTDPWISYNDSMIPRYKNLARVTYGLDGLHVPISSFLHEPDPANCKSKNQRQMSMSPWGLTIGLQAMTLQNMWQKYLCDQDVAYMKEKIYPYLKEVATFYVSLMGKCKRDKSDKVLLGPSFSPEHLPLGIFNCPFDIAYVHYTFDAMIEASDALKVDADLAQKCKEFKLLLSDYPTTLRNGKEIVVDSVGGDHIERHNITVPAVPVFPADQVTWFSEEAEKTLFRETIKQTRFRDANSHVMFNIARARLSMMEGFIEGRRWFSSRELPNGLFKWAGHGHGTFMGEMIGIAGLINEYLMQSVGNKIRLFPCWPKDKDAAFVRLRAQGGFFVSAEFKKGGVALARIESIANKQLQLLSPWKHICVNGKETALDKDGLLSLKTRPGDTFILTESLR